MLLLFFSCSGSCSWFVFLLFMLFLFCYSCFFSYCCCCFESCISTYSYSFFSLQLNWCCHVKINSGWCYVHSHTCVAWSKIYIDHCTMMWLEAHSFLQFIWRDVSECNSTYKQPATSDIPIQFSTICWLCNDTNMVHTITVSLYENLLAIIRLLQSLYLKPSLKDCLIVCLIACLMVYLRATFEIATAQEEQSIPLQVFDQGQTLSM